MLKKNKKTTYSYDTYGCSYHANIFGSDARARSARSCKHTQHGAVTRKTGCKQVPVLTVPPPLHPPLKSSRRVQSTNPGDYTLQTIIRILCLLCVSFGFTVTHIRCVSETFIICCKCSSIMRILDASVAAYIVYLLDVS